ncbi:MAG: ribonuclease D, partial [Hafnia alvei]
TSQGELGELGLSGPEIRFHGKTLVAMVAESANIPESEWPQPVERLVDHSGYKHAFKELKAVVQNAAERSGLTAELIASRRQINALLSWHWKLKAEQPDLLQGWRADLLGEQVRAILATL